jgi:hypothetical protein
MLRDKSILIVEDNCYLALDLSIAVEESNGRVIGPVGTVAEALALLEDEPIAAAVLGSQLADRDVTPVVTVLAATGVPFVIYTEAGLPPGVARSHPDSPLLLKPLHADAIVTCLLDEIKRLESAATAESRLTKVARG